MAPQFDESRHVPCQNAGSVPRAAEGIEGRDQIPAVADPNWRALTGRAARQVTIHHRSPNLRPAAAEEEAMPVIVEWPWPLHFSAPTILRVVAANASSRLFLLVPSRFHDVSDLSSRLSIPLGVPAPIAAPRFVPGKPAPR
jgi:hypothetical protein